MISVIFLKIDDTFVQISSIYVHKEKRHIFLIVILFENLVLCKKKVFCNRISKITSRHICSIRGFIENKNAKCII